ETLYVNGVPKGSRVETLSGDNTTSRTLTFQVHIGAQTGTAPSGGTVSRQWNGLLDEIRGQSRARSADWIKLEYQNQRADQSLVTFTNPVSVSPSAASISGLDFAAKTLGSGILFSLRGAADARAALSLVDVWGRTVWSGNFVD